MRLIDARPAGHDPRYQVSLLSFIIAGIACLAGAGLLGLRVNLTGSIPVGVYRVIGDASELHHGDVVLACLPDAAADLAHERGYVPRGGACAGGLMPVGKMVAAVAGDTVTVTRDGLRVNGRGIANSRALAHDAVGRGLNPFPSGRYEVPGGELWLIGASPRSFDSRYIGPIAAANVITRLQKY